MGEEKKSKVIAGLVFVFVLLISPILNYKLNFPSETIINILFLVYFIFVLFFNINSKMPILAALLLLILTPFLLIQKREAFANQVAMYSYYFLVIGVIKQFKDYVKDVRSGRMQEE